MKQILSNRTWAKLVVDFFYKKEIRYICMSPGSRNTPLTEAFINHGKMQCFSHIDERSLCYYAVGIAKASGKPVAVLTTSGTATANLFPGIIEAKLSNIPLFILTADRPLSLLNTGSPQTINQKGLYGEYVNKMLDIDHKKTLSNTLIAQISRVITIARDKNPGPVHINFRFDEPLFDSLGTTKNSFKKRLRKFSEKSEELILPKFKRPLIICGPMNIDTPIKYILSLSKKINAPIFADILSQIRHIKSNDNVLVYYEHYLNSITPIPDLILRFGDKPTSKDLNIFLDENKSKTFLIDEFKRNNDDCQKKLKIKFSSLLSHIKTSNKGINLWIEHLKEMEKNVSQIINNTIKGNNQATLVRKVLKQVKKGDHIFIGNSMPIRMFDRFSGFLNVQVNVFGNHITRGIDGIISTALGVSTINKKSSNYLFIGDISFFYDINGFHILKNERINLTIIVVNNKGGQIFSQLPYADRNIRQFDKYWITPPFTKIKDVATLFKLKYYKYHVNKIGRNLNRISTYRGVKIIEVIISNNSDKKILTSINQFIK